MLQLSILDIIILSNRFSSWNRECRILLVLQIDFHTLILSCCVSDAPMGPLLTAVLLKAHF